MAHSYCASQVRENSRLDYQLCLFGNGSYQDALFTLFAFDGEVAKIPRITSETMTALIRLQWWRDAIDEIYNHKPRNHPVVLALSETIHQCQLPKELFDLYLLHREWEIEPDDKPSSIQLNDYFDYVFGGFQRLLLLAMDSTAGVEILDMAQRLGADWGRLCLLAQLEREHRGESKSIRVIEDGQELEGSLAVLPDYLRSCLERRTNLLVDSDIRRRFFPIFGREFFVSKLSAGLVKKPGTSSDLMTHLSILHHRGGVIRLLWYRLTGR
jgi:hypothetical protein